MRTHTQLKVLFAAMLIALATLTIVAAPAQVTGGRQSKSLAVVARLQDAPARNQALHPTSQGVDSDGHLAVSHLDTKRHNDRVMSLDNSLSFLPVVMYDSGGYYATSVAVGDVNGDGRPDLITTNICQKGCSGNGVVGVLLGNGDGTFQSAVSYDSGGLYASSVTVADLNGDGKLDLVVVNGKSDSVAVFLGNGDGTFQASVSYSSGYFGPDSATVADVNGDGRPDILFTTECPTSVHVEEWGSCWATATEHFRQPQCLTAAG